MKAQKPSRQVKPSKPSLAQTVVKNAFFQSLKKNDRFK